MNPERWQRIKEVAFAAMELEEGQRSQFFDKECGSDNELRRAAEALVDEDQQAGSTIERGIVAAAAGVQQKPTGSGRDTMLGRTISHYKITKKLGEGGMGVVYKAEDTKLKRSVALKFLPVNELGGEAEKARFLREAQAAASLNHPNICTIYEIDESEGQTFIAMECVEGRTVKDKIASRPQPLEEALDFAIQAAQGLKAAHQKEIVHRDIKPANLMLTKEGQVKVMDFGLAQPGDATRLTKTGGTLGTIAYMPPEQAQGKEVDHRADIWSLGVVIYELVSGQLPFKGGHNQLVAHNILHEEPEPITALRAGVPMELEWIVGKALAKDRVERYQQVEELIVDLRGLRKKLASGQSTVLAPGSSHAHAAESPRQMRRAWLQQWGLGTALALAMGVIVAQWLRAPNPQAIPLARFSFEMAKYVGAPTISPDGRKIAYVALEATQGQGQQTIWIQDLDQNEPREIEGTAGSRSLFWSPDSSSLGFTTEQELKKVSDDGGSAVILYQGQSTFDLEKVGSWSPSGDTIVFVTGERFYEVPARGGTPKILTRPREIDDPREVTNPHFLPLDDGGRALLFTLKEGEQEQIAIWDLETGLEEVLHDGRRPIYSSTGHVIFEGGLGYQDVWALPFSLAKRKPAGEAFPIAYSAVSPTTAAGTLVYRQRGWGGGWQLGWRSRNGESQGAIGRSYGGLEHVALSRDGNRVAINGWTEGNQDIWVLDIATEVSTRLTFDRERDIGPVWSHAGKELLFSTAPNQNDDIYLKSADGSGEATPLTATDWWEFATDWSADGRYILYDRHRPESETRSDIWCLQRKDDGMDFEPAPFLETAADEHAAKFSPDGRYVAYVSDESGQYEVYAKPFPHGGGQWQLSFDGGVQPQWRGDGKELFYVSGNTLMVVAVSTEPTFSLGRTSRLFESEALRIPQWSPRYDVTADGQRIVVREPLFEGVRTTVHVVQNWYAEFAGREQD